MNKTVIEDWEIEIIVKSGKAESYRNRCIGWQEKGLCEGEGWKTRKMAG